MPNGCHHCGAQCRGAFTTAAGYFGCEVYHEGLASGYIRQLPYSGSAASWGAAVASKDYQACNITECYAACTEAWASAASQVYCQSGCDQYQTLLPDAATESSGFKVNQASDFCKGSLASGRGAVMGQTKVNTTGTCTEGTFSDAVQICSAAGGRLCTESEVEGGCVTADIGCDYDGKMVWTSSPAKCDLFLLNGGGTCTTPPPPGSDYLAT